MPMTDKSCPECGGTLHTDDLIENECITPGCGHTLSESCEYVSELPDA